MTSRDSVARSSPNTWALRSVAAMETRAPCASQSRVALSQGNQTNK